MKNNISVGKHEGKSSLGRPRSKGRINGLRDVDWIRFRNDFQWRASVKVQLTFCFHKKARNYMTTYATVRFSGITLRHFRIVYS